MDQKELDKAQAIGMGVLEHGQKQKEGAGSYNTGWEVIEKQQGLLTGQEAHFQ